MHRVSITYSCPAPWPLFELRQQGVGYVWTVLPFGWCESPYVYYSFSEAKASFFRSKGIPAVAYIADSWSASVRGTHEQLPRRQWLAAAEAIHVAMLVSWMCGPFLLPEKCSNAWKYYSTLTRHILESRRTR